MKLINYKDEEAVRYNSEAAKSVTGRVVIGKKDGAQNFAMRVFEVEPGGYTPLHTHDWEHEIFFHAGQAEVYQAGTWVNVGVGSVVFVPSNEEHQIRNTGAELLVFVCLVPAHAPEL